MQGGPGTVPEVHHEQQERQTCPVCKIHKTLYGLLQSAVLVYHRLVLELEDYGFKPNPYDPCVANMDINGSHMTVVWYVDDLVVTHKSDSEITKLGLYLEDRFSGLTINRNDKHTYLGINFDFRNPGEI